MPSTTIFEFGDIVLVPFPFTDQSSSKQRPAAVVSSTAYHRERRDLILLAITSQVRASSLRSERPIDRWREAGLLKPSVLKPVLATVDNRLVRRSLDASWIEIHVSSDDFLRSSWAGISTREPLGSTVPVRRRSGVARILSGAHS